jgi:outer membrane biosynthesis protein TonB
MAYLINNDNSFGQQGNRAWLGLGVAVSVHALLGYVFIAGLAPKIIATIAGETILVTPPKTEVQIRERPVPLPTTINIYTPPPIFVPEPIIDINTVDTGIKTTNVPIDQPANDGPLKKEDSAATGDGREAKTPPPPEAVRVGVDRAALLKALGRKQRPDFPPSVVRAMEAAGQSQVAVGCEVVVGVEGRITEALCESTGYERLDELVKRFFVGTRVQPATVDGKPVASRVGVQRFVWRLEGGR